MVNCILKINKDHFFVFEEFMKNEILFSKGKVSSDLERGTRGKTYSAVIMVAPLKTGL